MMNLTALWNIISVPEPYAIKISELSLFPSVNPFQP
ncbi:hypothetical protein SAMN05421788_106216 [Filimonas lacunae]|uniref:Uncharacterized protein n=1 Tax=Filimonas lacunae TaxID=477680 RepID=A0A1N7QQ98_9BACT|nr:hypothetical protein SAMN05421788_106216 [Filimonas lacunae]